MGIRGVIPAAIAIGRSQLVISGLIATAVFTGACDLTFIPAAPTPADQPAMGRQDDDLSDNQVLASDVDLPVTHDRAQPDELNASPAGTDGIELTWSDNAADEDGFLIQRQTADGGWMDLATVGPNVSNYTDTQVAAGETHCYRVLAFNSVTQTAASTAACATVAAATPASESDTTLAVPAAPTKLVAAAEVNQIRLTWQDNSNNETTFQIRRSAAGAAWTDYASVATDTTVFVDQSVEPGTSYCYKVSAINLAGVSAETTGQCVEIAAEPPATPPSGGGGSTGGGSGGSDDPPPPCLVNCPSPQPNRAFPSAEGFGALSAGGRGGRILHVTTLDDYDPATEAPIEGSLRRLLEIETGPRIIVFDVGGTIRLKDWLFLTGERGSRITIAGQTAPGDGIQLGQFGLNIGDGVHNLIVRHVRIRPTMTAIKLPLNSHDFLKKCVLINNNRKGKDTVNRDIIFDHCSLEWGMDGSVGMGDIQRITFQWCIVGEGSLYGDVLPAGVFDGNPAFSRAGESSQGMGIGESVHRFDDLASIHHCLFINNKCRNPMIYTNGSVVEFVNNLVYNHASGATVSQFGTITESARLNFIGNRFQRGPSRTIKHNTRPLCLNEETRVPGKESNAPTPDCLYTQGNLDNYWRPDESSPEWAITGWIHWPGFEGYYGYLPEGFSRGYYYNALDELYRADTPFPGAATPITVHAAADLEVVLAPTVGASLPQRDTLDTRLLNELQSRGGAIGIGANQQPPRWAADGSVIATGHDPLPILSSGRAPADADRDGMPDSWETGQGLNPNDPADASLDPDGDGYTNIEEYLNHLAGEE
ncbi:MAG TPA: fibronectin type III domain-containing protein [Phycisphaerae bacterium]|nr:fibronectin type III domain-containing protein [Phycisphaerae bacterium]